MDFDEIYRAYFQDVYFYLCSLTKDRALAQELAQEAFFRALRALNSFDGKSDVRAWLFAIGKNAFLSHCRKTKKTAALPEDAPAVGVALEEQLLDRQEALKIHQYLHGMAEPYKEVFTLRVFGELPFADIGALFGKSGDWARVVFYRAKLQIRRYMEGLHDEPDGM